MSGTRMNAPGYGLTDRARELLAYLRERETCPSFEEMRQALRLASKSSVLSLARQLEERGHIRRLANRARAIEVLPQDPVVINGHPFRFIAKTHSRAVALPLRDVREPAGACEQAPGLGGHK